MSLSEKNSPMLDDQYDMETVDRTYAQTFISNEIPLEDCDLGIRHERKTYFININSIDANLCQTTLREDFPGLLPDFSSGDCQDLSKSFSSLSVNSSIFNEELILDDEISLMPTSKSDSSLSPSLLYTLSEVKNTMSSVFQSFNWQIGLMKSVPQSIDNSIIVHCRSFETQDPCITLERMDLDLGIDRILPATQKITQRKSFENDSGLETVFRKTCCEPLMLEEIEAQARNTETYAEIFTGQVVIEVETNDSCCGCRECKIF